MSEDNVVHFPRVGSPPPEPTMETITESRREMRMMHIEEAMSFLMPLLFGYLAQGGFVFADTDDEEYDPMEDPFFKDGTIVAEAIKSLLMKYYGLDHPLQKVAEAMFVIREGGDYAMATMIDAKTVKMTANGTMYEVT